VQRSLGIEIHLDQGQGLELIFSILAGVRDSTFLLSHRPLCASAVRRAAWRD